MTTRPAAFFDVDGTLTKSDVFRDLVSFRAAASPKGRHGVWLLGHPFRGLSLLALDRVSRTAVNRLTSSWYRGFTPEALASFARSFQAVTPAIMATRRWPNPSTRSAIILAAVRLSKPTQ